jgi:hypothetical protein
MSPALVGVRTTDYPVCNLVAMLSTLFRQWNEGRWYALDNVREEFLVVISAVATHCECPVLGITSRMHTSCDRTWDHATYNTELFCRWRQRLSRLCTTKSALSGSYSRLLFLSDSQIWSPCCGFVCTCISGVLTCKCWSVALRCSPAWSPQRAIIDRDSSVGIATRYRLGGPGFKSRWGRDFPRLSIPALVPIQPPVQWFPALFTRG